MNILNIQLCSLIGSADGLITVERKYSNTIKRNLICAFINNSCGIFFFYNKCTTSYQTSLLVWTNKLSKLPSQNRSGGKIFFFSFPPPPNFPKTRKGQVTLQFKMLNWLLKSSNPKYRTHFMGLPRFRILVCPPVFDGLLIGMLPLSPVVPPLPTLLAVSALPGGCWASIALCTRHKGEELQPSAPPGPTWEDPEWLRSFRNVQTQTLCQHLRT